jgi:hypothetical protein
MSSERYWEILPTSDFGNRANWRVLSKNRYAAFRAFILIIERQHDDSRLGPVEESYDVNPHDEIKVGTKRIRSISNTNTIKDGVRYTVSSKLCDKLAAKVSTEIGAKVPGFTGKVGSEIDASTEKEIITTAENTFEGTRSYTIQETTEQEFVVTLTGSKKSREAKLRRKYWRHRWDVYLHSYEYLELDHKHNLIWKDIRKTIKHATSSVVGVPLFSVEFFVPQANLNVSYGAVDQEIENPSAIRVLPPPTVNADGWRPNATPLEELARLAFPVTKEEKSTAAKAKKTPSKRKPNAALMRPVQPDDKLAAIVGSKPLPRSELTKKLWDYIKKNGCQDKKKRTMINATKSLKPVFNGKSQVSMFEMTKLVSGHIK